MAGWTWAFGYDYLAHVWLEGPLRLHENALGPWLEDMASCDPGLSRAVAAVVGALDDPAELEVAKREFQSCVVVPIPGRYVPPYASVYLDASKALWGAVTAQVLSWYGESNLEWVGHVSRYPWVRAPDHVGVECAFAAELWTTMDSGQDPKVDLAQEFVTGHLLQWVPHYAAKVRERVTGSYWQGMAGLLEGWVRKSALSVPGVATAAVAEPHVGDRATDRATGLR
ncbi:MAG: molecular chaperone TorD family protein [Actinomycetota bacterium]|jgi:TorA maturation chaperone TorD|nr:molecular chaperone TorD family protein [Actinomycetota bacterium]